jgi:crotonobetaine/carnitine-CoA ligase
VSVSSSPSVVIDLLRQRATSHPHETFLLTPDGPWTYQDLWVEVQRVAGGLSALGIGKGNHVALMLDNGPHFLAAWFAANLLGAVEVPINVGLAGDPLHYVLEQSASSTLIAEDHHLDKVAALGGLPEPLRIVVGLGKGIRLRGLANHDWSALGGPVPDNEVGPRDCAAVMYTSGTTGRSKGAMLSHAYFLHMAAANVANMRLGPDDVYYNCLPLFHGMGQLSGTVAPLLAGAKIALVPRFSVSRFFDDCRSFGATGFGAIAAMTTMLYNRPVTGQDRDHHLRFGFSVAVPPTIHRSFEQRFGLRLIDGYGITEGGQITYSPYDAPRIGSCGKPVPLYDVEIHDEAGYALPSGATGEIVVRPRQPGVCMDGYFDQPEATVAAFRDLWLHTGDIGRFDEDGYLYFIDRGKDSIRRRGENISSMEVEALVAKHPAIAEVAAYPIPSKLGEDDVMIAVVFRDGLEVSWDEVLRHCHEELPRFALPRYLRRLDAMPRTPTQKIEKFRLRSEGVTHDTFQVPER